VTRRRKALFDGVRDMLPMVLGAVPFGLITGVSAIGVGMVPGDAVLMSGLVYAGAAQLAAFSLMGPGASIWVIVLTIAMVNLRFVMYSASIAPWLRRYGIASRLLVAYLMVDQAYALGVLKFRREDADFPRREYMLGMGVTMWLAWMAATAAGAILGAQLPPEWQLDFAVPLSFLALLVPVVRTRPMLVAALTGGSLALALAPLPYNLGLVVASLSGIAAGAVAERLLASRPA